MVNIPSNITNPDEAKHWLRVNGYSAERAEAIAAEWAASDAPDPAPNMEEEVEEEWEDEDWEDEDESEEDEE